MNIFDDKNKVKGNWFQTNVIGNKLQGTYIGKRQVINKLSGKEQWVYEIKTDNKEYWNVGGKPGIDMQMKHIVPGQIIGFEYTETRKSTTPGMHDSKIVQVYANPDVIDETYSAEAEAVRQAELDARAASIAIAPAVEVEAEDDEDEGEGVDAKIQNIMEIAKTKWSITDPTLVKQKVMEVTGLAFIESNLDKIVGAIK